MEEWREDGKGKEEEGGGRGGGGEKGEGEEKPWILSAEISKSVPGLFQLLALQLTSTGPPGLQGGDFLSV